MDDGVIGRWVAMVVSLVFYVGEGAHRLQTLYVAFRLVPTGPT
jgi:hypothetical protein